MLKQIIFFSCFGITIEVIFTALSDLLDNYRNKQPLSLALKGHTYIWMIPIHGLIPVFYPTVYGALSEINIFLRLLIYAIIIVIFEYVAGFMLERLAGRCPWKYSSGIHIHGYARLDYIPFWMFFGFVVEKLFPYI